jgi:hypothetical protein
MTQLDWFLAKMTEHQGNTARQYGLWIAFYGTEGNRKDSE